VVAVATTAAPSRRSDDVRSIANENTDFPILDSLDRAKAAACEASDHAVGLAHRADVAGGGTTVTWSLAAFRSAA
jgi:hypothetical protein